MKKENTSSRLITLMNERNLRQVDILELCKPFCEKFNVKLGRNDLSQYVSGKVIPGQKKLTVLGLALNVNEAWLMGYDVPRHRAPIITNHSEINDDILCAIQILAELNGYKFDLFAKQYQISYGDVIIKLAPDEVDDLVNSCIEQVRFIFENILGNKIHDNIVPIKTDRNVFVDAAHERTDTNYTEEDRQADDDMLD